ncbi:MAG: HAMP domain-containing histidine kinase, partial [Actinobacteria bacterium]
DRDANSVAQSRASAELSAVRLARGHIVLPEAPDDSALDSQVWVFEGGRALERPRSGSANDQAAAALVGGPRRFTEVSSTDTRLYSVPIAHNGRRLGTVVAGVSLGPYEQTKHTALIASIVVGVLALATAAAAGSWLISRALRPVALMTSRAAEWSERDIGRRFSLGEPHDELTQLAATLDGLLDRLAASLRREQRFSAELSHELRTPLASVIAEAQFALKHAQETSEYRAGFEQIVQSATQMNRTLETLLAAARAELDPKRRTSAAAEGARAAIEAHAALAADGGVELSLTVPQRPLRVAVEADLVEGILGPLMENACRFARSRVNVSVQAGDGSVHFRVADDGPGVQPEDREAIFEPGQRRPSEQQPGAVATAGVGLGLSLSRRLARAAGGDVELGDEGPGACFIARLPSA